MRRITAVAVRLLPAIAAVVVFHSGSVRAADGDTCASDADCASGESCQVVGTSGCAAPICDPDDADCVVEDCVVAEIHACVVVPVACSADADCGENESCLTQTYTSCTEVAIPCDVNDEQSCEAAPRPDEATDCEEVTESFCAPKYLGGCQESADCGEGFECIHYEECACTGGGEIPPNGGSDDADPNGDPGAPAPPVEECDCRPAEEGYCELQKIECIQDADCPSGMVCFIVPVDEPTDPDAPISCVDEDRDGQCDNGPEAGGGEDPNSGSGDDQGREDDADAPADEPNDDSGALIAPTGFCAPPDFVNLPGEEPRPGDVEVQDGNENGDPSDGETPRNADDDATVIFNCNSSNSNTAPLWGFAAGLFALIRRRRR